MEDIVDKVIYQTIVPLDRLYSQKKRHIDSNYKGNNKFYM